MDLPKSVSKSLVVRSLIAGTVSTPIDKNDPLPGSWFFPRSSLGRAPHDGVQEVWHLDVKSAVRIARRDDFEIANTFRPGRDACSAEADLGWLRLVHAPRISAWNTVPSVHMAWRMTAILRARATLAFLVPMRLANLVPQRLSAEPCLTTVSRTFAASNK